MAKQQTIYVTIISREKKVYEGEAKAVSSINEKGLFDILPEHTNFISVIKEKVIVEEPNGKKTEFPLIRGVVRVLEGRVQVLIGTLPKFTNTPNQKSPQTKNPTISSR